MTDSFLRCFEVQARTGLSRSAIYQMKNQGRFPEPYRIGNTKVVWSSTEVADWIEQVKQHCKNGTPI